MTIDVKRISIAADDTAPDGSEVRLLCSLPRGGLAHFLLPPKTVSKAVAHRTVDEIWYFLSGYGQMWRQLHEYDEVTDVALGVSITIPVGTKFQFRCDSFEPLIAIGATMPAWPGKDEAYFVEGRWRPTVESPPHEQNETK